MGMRENIFRRADRVRETLREIRERISDRDTKGKKGPS